MLIFVMIFNYYYVSRYYNILCIETTYTNLTYMHDHFLLTLVNSW